jgi:DNA polymerase (family 10)
MEIGVQYARSAWIKKDMIVNTKTAGDLLSFLKKTRASEPLGESRAARALMR